MDNELDLDFINDLHDILLPLKTLVMSASITGGAIRDMFNKKPIKDIDVFYSCSDKAVEKIPFGYVDHSFVTDVKEFDCPEYEDQTFKVTHVGKYLHKCPIQFIKVPLVAVAISKFPLASCQGRYSLNFGLQIPIEMIRETQTKTFKWLSKPSLEYEARMKAKYDDWNFIPYQTPVYDSLDF